MSESVTEVPGRLTWSTPTTHQTRSVPVPRTLATRAEELGQGRTPDEPIVRTRGEGMLVDPVRRGDRGLNGHKRCSVSCLS